MRDLAEEIAMAMRKATTGSEAGYANEMHSAWAAVDVVRPIVDALKEAKSQIEYLHEKFGETGSGNAVLARINAALSNASTC